MRIAHIYSIIRMAVLGAGCAGWAGVSLPNGLAQGASNMREPDGAWNRPALKETRSSRLGGDPGRSLQAGLDRLTRAPFDKDFILADVNFNQKRWFTNFSGDISGRFIEVASAVSSPEQPWPEVLMPVLDEIGRYQKEDGHFGAVVDWSQPIDFDPTTDQTVMMPILWGNGRLLLGLTEAARRFSHAGALTAAKKLGDFYGNTVVPRFCDPDRMAEYRKEGQYASAYVTCVFEGMEGLANLYRLTGDPRYLATACRMADFHESFDTLPAGHSHGSLGQTCMLVRLFETTGKAGYLQRAVCRWDEAVSGGYVNPSGSVLEKFWTTGYNRDEGCSEGDWLRLNLLLWANTGETRYLDMAERLLWNGILPNQWDTGGFGHRFMGVDEMGPYAYLKHSQESLWCCSFHVPWAMHEMLSYLAVGSAEGVWYNFPMEFETEVEAGPRVWALRSRSAGGGASEEVRMVVELVGSSGARVPPLHVRVPEWAQDVAVTVRSHGAESRRLDATVDRSNVKGRNVRSVRVRENLPSASLDYTIVYAAKPYLEDRRFQRIDVAKARADGRSRIDGVVFRQGPFVNMNPGSGEIQDILFDQIAVQMRPYIELENKNDPHAFVFNVPLTLSGAPGMARY